MTLVLGIDPSLTATGYAWGSAHGEYGRLRPGGNGLPRYRWLARSAQQLVEHLVPHGLRLVVIEGPSYGSQAESGYHERAGAWWRLLDVIDDAGVPVAVAPPAQVKMVALGKGGGAGTDKPAVVAAARDRLGYRGTDNNEADALWLAALGYEHLGAPRARLPAAHRRALAGVAWPTVPPIDPLAVARRTLGG